MCQSSGTQSELGKQIRSKMELSLLLIIALGILVYFLLRGGKKYAFPPGPRGLPILGNLFQLDVNFPHHTLTEWSKKYGNIYTINLLGKRIVVVSGYEKIHHVLVTESEAFAGRPHQVRLNIMAEGSLSFLSGPYTEKFRLTKKAVMNSFKSYGDGLQRLEDLVLEVSEEMLEKMDEYNGKAFDPKDVLQETMTKIVSTMIYGKRLSKEATTQIMEMERKMIRLFAIGGSGTELEIIPWLKYFRQSYVQKLLVVKKFIQDLHKPLLLERKADAQGRMECVVDALYKSNDAIANPENRLSEADLVQIISETLNAGLSTSSAALYAMLAICTEKPELQSRMQKEIDDVLGSRRPSLSDRAKLPYMMASILELLRYISHVPMSLPHITCQEVHIDEYTLPKGTEVWMNLWDLHHDNQFWDEPWEFKTERFLTPDGEVVPPDHCNRQRLMPFGAGRRVCGGESLAKSRLFILMTLILQNFKLQRGDENKRPETDPRRYISGLALTPDRYKIKLVARNTE